MIEDGFLERFPRADVCLGQHVFPAPVGFVSTRPGPVMAASDSLRVRLFGRGGHGSTPETAVDPVVMAAAVVMRLQTVVSREVGASQTAVVTVGSIHAGTKENIIPDTADLRINIRSTTPAARKRVLAAVERIVRAEAAASGAPKDPEITGINSFPSPSTTTGPPAPYSPRSPKSSAANRSSPCPRPSPAARTSVSSAPRSQSPRSSGTSAAPTQPSSSTSTPPRC
ncbi:peptidase dimerization domain-containing protein [Streptomyces sp. NBC_00893]|uniref:peptidase dimerization domain-containing protein n=1 Tax=Streptomyces sp. NBC_00893 TaxID=2975862 RepID=UPI002B1E339D|nr:peptidase dimerization domain-containing protein [Streptomyces sp. NBC_00893]